MTTTPKFDANFSVTLIRDLYLGPKADDSTRRAANGHLYGLRPPIKDEVIEALSGDLRIEDGQIVGLLAENAVPALPPEQTAERIERFVRVGTVAINQGHMVARVPPNEKRSDMYAWNDKPITKISDLWQHAKDYPTYNVAVVSWRGEGNDVILDIDAPGVQERIETATGHSLDGLTYTVLSRPQTATYKRHFYFKQTRYSMEKLGTKEINVKNLTVFETDPKTGKAKHPNLYDVKGCGGGGFVVAAGSVRDSGEEYTAVDLEAVVIPIPDWLVDWIAADHHKYLSNKTKMRIERTKAAARLSPDEKKRLQGEGVDSAFEISLDDVFPFLSKRAGTYAAVGTDREDIEMLLRKQTRKFVSGGADFMETDEGRRLCHKVAFDPSLKIGNANYFSRTFTQHPEGTVIFAPVRMVETRTEQLTRIIKTLPPDLPSPDAYERINRQLQEERSKAVSPSNPADRRIVARARKAAGIVVANVSGAHVWSHCLAPLDARQTT